MKDKKAARENGFRRIKNPKRSARYRRKREKQELLAAIYNLI